MKNIEFETKVLGKCRVLALANNNALIEKMYDTPERYIIAMGFNEKDNTWRSGLYRTDINETFEEFTKDTILVNNTPIKIIEEYYNDLIDEMKKLREQFEDSTIKDNNLLEHFNKDNPKNRFSHIMVAGTIIAGIELRNNMLKDSEKMEKIPYSKEQVEMIDKYTAMEKSIQSIEDYIELNNSEEMEY